MGDATEKKTLRVTLRGPLVDDHKLPLSELLRIAKQLRLSLRDVAVVLTSQKPSGFSGRASKAVELAADLNIVAAPSAGSFVLELETPTFKREKDLVLFEEVGHDLSAKAVEAFLDGLPLLDSEMDQLPHGFDRGVLKAISPLKTAFGNGLSEIELSANGNGKPSTVSVSSELVETVRVLIKRPVRAETWAEGVLQMVDFGSLECRIDRAPLPSVTVYFDEKMRNSVHDAVRQFVRVSGEGQFEPGQPEATKLWAQDFTIRFEALPLDPRAFFESKPLGELATGHAPFHAPDDRENDGWRDDAEALALLEAVHGAD